MSYSDTFREECGVVAIYAHPEAEKLAYLGLHALQRRGQESAGIVSSDGMTLRAHKAMGWSQIFSSKTCSRSCAARWQSATRATRRPEIRRCSMRSRSWCSPTRDPSRWRTTETW